MNLYKVNAAQNFSLCRVIKCASCAKAVNRAIFLHMCAVKQNLSKNKVLTCMYAMFHGIWVNYISQNFVFSCKKRC